MEDVDRQLAEWRRLPDDSRVTISLADLRALRVYSLQGRLPPPTFGGVPAPEPRNAKGQAFPHQHKAAP
jgi:hypothetical protein